MAEVIVYGASDDLIEVQGHVREEFSTDGSGDDVLIVGSHGQIVKVGVKMEDEGWVAWGRIINQGTLTPNAPIKINQVPRPEVEYGEDGDMAVLVRLEDEDHLWVFKIDRYV